MTIRIARAITTLLEDPFSSLCDVSLSNNGIGNEGVLAIANSLKNNNQLQKLYFYGNPMDPSVDDIFHRVLCNTSTIENTYSSNHTLETLNVSGFGHQMGQQLVSLLRQNEDTNKSHVAMKKILKYHPNIDMEPFFEWDAEGEQTLKALPHVIKWFERARLAVANDEEDYRVEDQKLSVIFQFSKAMPLLFEGIVNIRVAVNSKRKRSDG